MEVNTEFKGVPLIIVGTYEKKEDRVMYYDNLDGFPGSGDSYSINEIYAEDSEIDLYELFSAADLQELESKILEQLND